MWKYLVLFPIVMSIVIVFFSQVGNTYAQVNETSLINTYENITEGIRFQYPSYWDLTSQGG